MFTRRSVLATPVALAACNPFASAEPAPSGPIPSLKDIAPFPIGAALSSAHLDDPDWRALAKQQLSQLTTEWELKMEYVLQDGPGTPYRFEAPDRIAAFARDNNMRLYCTTLVWYSQGASWLNDLSDSDFRKGFDDYIAAVTGRYAGQAVGWDCVNEAVAEDGDGLRDCIWSQRLGGKEAYIERSFEKAREADPDTVLFLNDYNLEYLPRKRRTFLNLVEKLMSRGVPIGGIGNQAHLDIEAPVGSSAAFLRDAASLGLPIHVSELDFPKHHEGLIDTRTEPQKRAQQIAHVRDLAEAYMALPAAQQFGFTTWGLRDPDSWLLREEGKNWPDASPLFFDAQSRPNPAFQTAVDAFSGKS